MSAALKPGYILDAATGKPVDGRKPEEPVRQQQERILHEDYGYDLGQMAIEVHIQRGSKVKPKNDRDRADIVIYRTSDPGKRDQNRDVLGIVECKRPQREDGVGQLMSYLSASNALWGIWTNGSEIEYLYHDSASGEVKRNYVYQIPRKGQSFEDIGRLKKSDLKPAKNLKPIFWRIHQVLYANTNISRKEKLGSEMIRLIFCKIWDERYSPADPPRFKIGFRDRPEDVKKSIEELFGEVKEELVEDGVFDDNERILIDPRSVAYVVGELEQFSLSKTDKDIVGDAFEVFAESKLVGEKGEFFTPREVVKMAVRMVDPKPRERVFDPACGSGGFLIYALEHVWEEMERSPRYKGTSRLEDEKKRIAERCFAGIDKEIDLVKIAKAYMAIVGDGRGSIVQENTLHRLEDWSSRPRELFTTGDGEGPRKFDVILTNPPFGSKIKVIESEDLRQFDLAHKWTLKGDRWVMDPAKTKKTEPQLLFIERCLDFLNDGGRMAIVLPEGVLGNPSQGWVRQYIEERAEILAVIDCPAATFMPHTHTKTSVLVLRKWKNGRRTLNYPIFNAIVRKAGHDLRGNDIRRLDGKLDEEFSEVADRFLATGGSRIVRSSSWDRRGFTLYQGDLVRGILIPRYYDPATAEAVEKLHHDPKVEVLSISDLVGRGLLSVRGASATAGSEDYTDPVEYDENDVPFVCTSDISNWEVSHTTDHRVPESVWQAYKDKQDLQPGDILFVKDGTYLIGDTALITEHDLRTLVQGHFYILRSLNPRELPPSLLLYLLNLDIVREQVADKTFVQATLSTIGDRLGEVALPFPRDAVRRRELTSLMAKVIDSAGVREEIRRSLRTYRE